MATLGWVIGHSTVLYRNVTHNQFRARERMDQILFGCDWPVVCRVEVVVVVGLFLASEMLLPLWLCKCFNYEYKNYKRENDLPL